jgi:hypothetical protein
MTISNGDMPANPSDLDVMEYEGTINCSYSKRITGLTKREAFAVAAMQGLLSSDTGCTTYHNEIVNRSVSLADALLKELER